MSSLVRADATAIPLADDTVDLIVTSPPYFALRSYTDGGEHYDGQIGSEPTPQAFLEALWAVTAECRRVLKPSGSMFVNLGDKYSGSAARSYRDSQPLDGGRGRLPELHLSQAAVPMPDFGDVPVKSLMGLPWRYAIGCIDRLELILRAEIVWSKPNGLPESVTDRVRRSHEQWFHFTREPRYYAAVDEIREAYAPSSLATYAAGGLPHLERAAAQPNDSRYRHDGDPDGWRGNPLGKLPGSVWTIPSEPLKVPEHVGVDHFAAFPQEWPRRLILGWSPSGICVECGEGRAPVAHVEREEAQATNNAYRTQGQNRGRGGTAEFVRMTQTTTITGYACACPTPDAPTRPAVVLDPFVGTGTTVMVARALGRHGVGLDLSADYLKLATWRVHESGHAAKSRRRTNLERQGQLL